MTETKKPSEVFLRLWRYHTVSCGDATPADFALCADAWMQIRELETTAAKPQPFVVKPVVPVTAADLYRAVEGIQEEKDPSPEAQDDKDKEKPARDLSAISRAGAATRKRNDLAALDAARAAGISTADLAGTGVGLTVCDVMDLLDRKALPMTVYAKLEKALRKLGYPAAGEDPSPAAQDDKGGEDGT